MKKCFKCGGEFPLSEFYKHPQMADGHLGKCKTCNKRDVRENRAARADYYKAFDQGRANDEHRVQARADYQRTEAGKVSRRKAREKYYEKHPERKQIHQQVNNAVRDGRLVKTPCSVCGSEYRIHGHHDDYSKPLDVLWLCPQHHQDRHRKLGQ